MEMSVVDTSVVNVVSFDSIVIVAGQYWLFATGGIF